VLLGDDDDDEGAGLHLAAAFAGSGRIEVRSRKKDVVSFEVEPHGACAAFSGDVFPTTVNLSGESSWMTVRLPSAAGGERVNQSRDRSQPRRGLRRWREWRRTLPVSAFTTAITFLIADGKESAIGNVHSETGRRFARRERPVMEFLEARGIEMMQFGGVLVVYVDGAFCRQRPRIQACRADL